MPLYTFLAAIAGIVLGVLVAGRVKKPEALTYGALDKASVFTNIGLLVLYVVLSPFYMFIGMICCPAHEGFLGILGWIVAVIAASAPLFCGLSLGFSVFFRRKGKSKLGFAVQFAGFLSIILTFLLYVVFADGLLAPLN